MAFKYTLEELAEIAKKTSAGPVKEPCYEVLIDDIAGRFKSGEIGVLCEEFPPGEKYKVSLNLGTFFHYQLFGDSRNIVKYERVFLFRAEEVRLLDAVRK